MRVAPLLVVLAGCGLSADYGGTSYQCRDGVCPAGQTCVAGRCEDDAPPAPDAPPPAPPDAEVAPPPDAMPAPDAPPVFSPPWWDEQFVHRTRLSVTNGAAVTLPAGFQVRWLVNLNGTDLVIPVNDFDTFRVVRWDGAAWTELNRIIDDNAAAHEVVWVRLVEPVPAGASDESYFFYYGGPDSIPSGPASSSTMWDFYDGFNGTSLDAQWNESPAGTTIQVTGGDAILEPGESIRSDYLVGVGEAMDFEIEVANTSTRWWGGLQAAGTFDPIDPWAVWITRSDNVGNVWPEVMATAAGIDTPLLGPTTPLEVAEAHMYTVTREPTRLGWEYDAIETHGETVPSSWTPAMNLRFTNDTTSTNVLVNFARTRQYVRPFPVGTLLEGESLP